MSLSLFCYYYFFSSSKVKELAKIKDQKKLDDEDEEEDETEEIEEEEVDEEAQGENTATTQESTAIDEAAAFKAQYEAATKASTALINAQNYEEAVHKLTDAINLAPHVPFASSNLITLYNNRSAMYEKLQQYEHALRDITVILTMDPSHTRARIRRARVYEAQGKLELALKDYVTIALVEKYKGEQPVHEAKAAALSKKVALSRVGPTLTSIRNSKDRQLPSKAFLRTFFEAYPSIYAWRVAYEDADRDSLAQTLNTAKENADHIQILLSGLEVIRYDIVHEAITVALNNLHSIAESVSTVQKDSSSHDQRTRSAISQYYELVGTEAHLKADLDAARAQYELALKNFPENVSCQLKLVSLLNDLGEQDAARVMLESSLAVQTSTSAPPSPQREIERTGESLDESFYSDTVTGPPLSTADDEDAAVVGSKVSQVAVQRAWCLIHRASLWIARDVHGSFQEDAIPKALADLEEAFPLVENLQHVPEAAGAKFISLLKIVHVLTHTKQSMEQQVSESDSIRCREAITQAKAVFPDHESVLLMEAEQLSQEGDFTAAFHLLEKAKRRARRSQHRHIDVDHDVTFLVTRASILTAQAFGEMAQNGIETSLTLFQEVDQLYTHALEIEPNAIEVMAQLAQLKSMLQGDVAKSLELLQRALPLARSREEVQDLLMMLVMNEAQVNAVQEMQAANDLRTISGRS